MYYSQLFGKTQKNISENVVGRSHQLLYQAGFIRESTAGRYYMLPLGQRVSQKITNTIKAQMDNIGAQELLTPVLHPLSLWQETNRTQTAGFELMKIKDRHQAEFALGGTAEEMMVDLIRKFQLSYKDLPLNLYQFSLKFRDELRARGGLLRVREFLMKDAYSFDTDKQAFGKTYAQMTEVYKQIFKRLDLKTMIVSSDNGYIGGEYCHEFVVEASSGESKFYNTKDGQYIHEDIAKKLKLDTTKLVPKIGIEVGNIFQLGYHYSKLMKNATFIDKNGQPQPYYMGCYGIGIGRTMAAIVETHNDENGIIWPASVAPFLVHLVGLNLEDPKIKKRADSIYQTLGRQKIEVLYDNRTNISAGAKFADCDLIGIPYRVVVSAKTKDLLETKSRVSDKTTMQSLNEFTNNIAQKN